MMQAERRAFFRLRRCVAGGAAAEREPSEARSIFLTNFVALQGFAITLGYMAMYLTHGLFEPCLFLLPLLIVFLTAVFLNNRGSFFFARHLLISFSSFYVFVYACYLGPASDAQMTLLTIVANTFLLFSLRQWPHIFVALLQPFAYFIIVSVFEHNLISWQPAPYELIIVQSAASRYTTAIMLLVTLLTFAITTQRYESLAVANSIRLQKEVGMVRLLQDVAIIANHAITLPGAAAEASARIKVFTGWIEGDLVDLRDNAPRDELLTRLKQVGRGVWHVDPTTGALFVGLPIVTAGKTIAAKVFRVPSGEPPTRDLLANLDNVGRQLGIVAERERAREQVSESHMKMIAAAKMATLGEMAGGIAHEINNPLAVIQGYLARIERHSGMPQSQPMVQDAVVNINATILRITKIVTGLRSFARESGADPYESVRLDRVISDTLALSAERFKNRGIKLVVPAVPADLCVDCRPTEISQVLLNLLNNAYDAVIGQTEKRIELHVKDVGDELVLGVSDSGPGISPEIAQKILEPFFTTKPVGQGTGLGLSISKGLVESHGGSIEFESHVGVGTHFWVRLPKYQNGDHRSY